MSVKLTKGQGINLKKDAPNLERVIIGLGWEPKESVLMDIDLSVICIDSDGRKEDVIYYKHQQHSSGAIQHGGYYPAAVTDDGYDDIIRIVLDKIPENIHRLAIIVNIFSADITGDHFGKVKNCFVHADDMDTGQELVRYDINGNLDEKTGIIVADLYRYNDEWKFEAIGEVVKVTDINEMVEMKCKR